MPANPVFCKMPIINFISVNVKINQTWFRLVPVYNGFINIPKLAKI